MKHKICIIGAGWGGLSCAHYASKNKNNEIRLFERNDRVGGQASSMKMPKCRVEYSWRVFFEYPAVDKIMKELKIINSAFEKLGNVEISHGGQGFLFDTFKGKSLEEVGRVFNFTTLDLIKLKWLYSLPEPILVSLYSNTAFIDFMGPNPLLVMIAGPILGMEAMKLSIPAVVATTKHIIKNKSAGLKQKSWRVTSGTPDYSIFRHWKEYLIKKGVFLHLNNGVKNVVYIENKWKVTDGSGEVFWFDKVVMASSLKSTIKLLSPQFKMYKTVKDLKKLTNCLQNYLSFNFYFSEPFGEKFDFDWKKSKRTHSYILIDQPWQPIIEVKITKDWKMLIKRDCQKKEKIKEVWNTGVMDLIRGKYTNKFLSNCTYKEAIKETVNQVRNDPIIHSLRSESGKTFDEVFIGTEVFPFWKTGKNGKIYTENPKFSLNAGYEKYLIDKFPEDMPNSLYFSAYYCKTAHTGVSMERSCQIGTAVGKKLMK
jgi:hypothetical protein